MGYIYLFLTHRLDSTSQQNFIQLNFSSPLGGTDMALAQSSSLGKMHSWFVIKSFLIWTFTLAVCLLVVGFPLIVLMATVGALSAIILESVMPISAALLVAGSLIGFNVMAVIAGAGILTFKGIHPHEVSWLHWLHGEADPLHSSVYAACPLTCDPLIK